MSDDKRSKDELLDEITRLRRQVANLESTNEPAAESEGGEPIFGGQITRRNVMAAWVAPVILSIPVANRAAAQTPSEPGPGTVVPTSSPTGITQSPTQSPTGITQSPTGAPTQSPTAVPTSFPTMVPTQVPVELLTFEID